MLPTYMSNRKKTQEVSDKTDNIAEQIGQTNGHGTIADMITKLIEHSAVITERVNRLEVKDAEKKLVLRELKDDVHYIKRLLEQLLGAKEDGD